jgi:hypothetical protein
MKLQSSGKEFWLVVPKEFIVSNGWAKGDIFFSAPLPNAEGIQFIYSGKNRRNHK